MHAPVDATGTMSYRDLRQEKRVTAKVETQSRRTIKEKVIKEKGKITGKAVTVSLARWE